MLRAAALLLLLTLLAGCGGAAVAPAPPTPLPGQSAADAQATLTAWQLAVGATATTVAQQAQATAAAVDAQRATVAAATAVAVATRDALTIQTTAVALQMSIDSATSTAEAAAAQATSVAAVEQTADAAEMAAVAIVQQDTAIRLEQERRAEETRLRWQPVLYGVGIFALVALGVAGLAFVWFLLHRARYTLLNPVVELPNGGALARLPDGRGGFGAPQLVTISVPARPASAPLPALPAPAPQPTPLPSLAGAHVLIVGPTTTGKSNVLRQVAKALTGSAVYAIDTNYRPGAWPATIREVVGAAGDYDRVADLMTWLDNERRNRIARYAKGDAQFDPITLIMDEQWELTNFVPAPAMAAWKAVVRQGAKYGIYVVMATHSLLVKEMGLEGESSVIENFLHRIFLGPFAVERYPALDGSERPAIYMRGGSRRATPVVIPYHPEEDPRSPQFRVPAVLPAVNSGLYWGGGATLADGLFNRGPERKDAIVLPAPAAERPVDPRVDGLMTSRGWVGPLEVGKILEAHAAGLPHYKIEIAAFGYNEQGRPRCNGAFYHQVEDVLAFYGLSVGSTSSTDSTG
jgi:hypothetical protein